MRVLIIDDSTYIRSNLRTLLTSHNYEVVGEAKDGETALDLIYELKPDLITLDNILPDMTGLDILKAMKGGDFFPKIVMISAVGQQSAIVEAKELGVAEYLVKPFNNQELIDILEHLDEQSG